MRNCIKSVANLFAGKNVNRFVGNFVSKNPKIAVALGLSGCATFVFDKLSQKEYEEQADLCQELHFVRQQLKGITPSQEQIKYLEKCVELRSENEKMYFEAVVNSLDKENKEALNNLLAKGILLRNDSNNQTSVLENLYAILTSPRAEGLDTKNILNSVVRILDKPSNISQKMDNNFPLEEYGLENYSGISNTCAAASIEYDFADKYPAEFTRFVSELTSSNLAVKKVGNYDIEKLEARNIPYKVLDNGLVEVVLKPDEKALSYAQAQTKYQDEFEGSAVDILLQLTFAKSRGNQKNDYVSSDLGDEGFVADDVVFVENLIKEKNVRPFFYQVVDENYVVVDKTFSSGEIKEQIINSLEQNNNVIVGYNLFESDAGRSNDIFAANTICGGHEIIIVGYKKNQDGSLNFIIQDSAQGGSELIECSEEYLLPRLHHAFVSNDVAYDFWENKEEMLEKKITPRFLATM